MDRTTLSITELTDAILEQMKTSGFAESTRGFYKVLFHKPLSMMTHISFRKTQNVITMIVRRPIPGASGLWRLILLLVKQTGPRHYILLHFQ